MLSKHPQKEGPLQQMVEGEFMKIMNLGNFESVYLFSEEGLPIVELSGRGIVTADHASEIALTFGNALNSLEMDENTGSVREVLILTSSRRKIDLRYFRALDQNVTLVVVVPPGKTYRSHTNRMIRYLTKLKTDL